MAPFCSPTQEMVLATLHKRDAASHLPIGMGGPAGPSIAVGLLDGDFCLYRLRVDDDAYMAFAMALHEAGKPLFPEHRMQFLVPDEVLLRESTREAFIEAFAALEISFDERYQPVIKPRAGARARSLWDRLRRRG
ncbi:MAG: hypothetical protein KC636_04765 [Myxococcales bacterium]|nr:hypothetical protein [Myxococcales bacterium]